MVSSAYSEVADVTGVIPDRKFQVEPGNLPLDLLTAYKNRWGVVGSCDANDTMSRWSDQLLLTAENHHFEDSKHLKVEECTNAMVGEAKWEGIIEHGQCAKIINDLP